MRSFVLPALVCLGLAAVGGCGTARDTSEGSENAGRSYSTRGIVRALPSPDRPGSSLQIRHEPVAEFHGMDGEVTEMASMTMPFPADAALLEGVAVGDKVSFDFVVRWTGSPPMEVTRLEVLSPDTRLEFEAD